MSKAVWLCVGLLGGVLLALGIRYALGERGSASRADPEVEMLRREVASKVETLDLERTRSGEEVRRLTAENEQLKKALAEATPAAKPEPKPPPEAPTAPPTDEELMQGVGKFGASLGAIIQGGGEDAKKEIRDVLARAGKHGIDLLVAKFEDDATDIQMRAILAHALAQSGNPDAVATLTKVLGNPDAGMLELRLATHGLAFSDAPGIDDALLAVASRSADTGARANAAFGLARRKHPEGVGLYAKATDEAMANRDPVALQYLSGFFLLGDDGLPPMRERLLTYTEPQVLLTVIELLKMRGDMGALPNLRKLAADEGKPASIRRAAEGAVKALEAGK